MENLSQFFRKGRNLFWLVLAVVFLFFLFSRKNNVVTWVRAAFEIAAQKREIRQLEKSISTLNQGIEEMNTSADAAEKYAREELGFCAEDEDVYIVSEEK